MNTGPLERKIIKVFHFLEKSYPSNWQVRWEETPYMALFSKKREIEKVVKKGVKFETIPGHVWATMLLWFVLRRVCRNLDKVVDTSKLLERICVHDLAETIGGDTSIYSKYNEPDATSNWKRRERRDFRKLIKDLPIPIRAELEESFEEYEAEDKNYQSFETLVAKWLDNLQGNHFALVFGNNLGEYSELIEKIIKSRAGKRARLMMDYLGEKREENAASEVKAVMKVHIEMAREKGIDIDLSDLGFS